MGMLRGVSGVWGMVSCMVVWHSLFSALSFPFSLSRLSIFSLPGVTSLSDLPCMLLSIMVSPVIVIDIVDDN